MRNRQFDPLLNTLGQDEDLTWPWANELEPQRDGSLLLFAEEQPAPPTLLNADTGERVMPEPGPISSDIDPTEDPAPLPPESPLPELPPAAAPGDDPATISFSRILDERPDVLRAYYEAYYAHNDPNSTAWSKRVGGDTPEAYARYWYNEHGKYEGYNQGPTTAADNVDLERILRERPDVLRGFYEGFYGPNNDRHSDAWVKRVGGDTPEAYAKYWYEKYGKWEGYAQSDKAAAENINVERLLAERPDVFRAFYTEFYGPNNDHKSTAWIDRVGGDTVQDYAKYWYNTYGAREGYSQRPPPQDASPEEGVSPGDVPTEAPPVEDPSLDPWNHPAIYPDWQPPYPGWQPPGSEAAAGSSGARLAEEPPPDLTLSVGRSLSDPEIFG